MKSWYSWSWVMALFVACATPEHYDVILRNGTIFDGSGAPSYVGDVGLRADTIAAIGDLKGASATVEIDVTGKAVAPGFINMLSWAPYTLIVDGKSQSDIRQGVTLEVFGEGSSLGPLNEAMRKEEEAWQTDVKYPVDWTTLKGGLDFLVNRGISTNIASFVGATTLRVYTVGYEDRAPTEAELDTMRQLTRQAMEEGALGVGSSLIYAPAFYSSTEELIALCKVASEYGGMYISHMRSEGSRLLESLDELIRIAAEAGVPAEVYHLKMSGKANWDKFDAVVAKIDSARTAGLSITTDMYTYTAGATGLDAAMPPWVQEGGYEKWAERLKDPEIRKRVIEEMRTPTTKWESLMQAAQDPSNMLLVEFRADSLRYHTGKTLKEVSEHYGLSPEETAIELVIRDGSRVGTVYFLMSEENVRKQIELPYMSFGSDAGSLAPEGIFLNGNEHPRAYGNFARLLGKYVRDEGIISLEEAVYRLTTLPATNLKIKNRGALQPGYFADVVVFDPETITDHATFPEPHQFATGMEQVFVNGVLVLKDGEHTGATPGRVVHGPGWKGD